MDCNTVDRFTESAGMFMRWSRAVGYSGGFSGAVFNHDQAYRRVRQSRRLHCLVPVILPGGWDPLVGGQAYVLAGEVHHGVS